MNIKKDKLPDSFVKQVVRLHKQGRAPVSIAEALSEKLNRIYYALRREGIVLTGAVADESNLRAPHHAIGEIIGKYLDGYSCRKIGQMHRLSGQLYSNYE